MHISWSWRFCDEETFKGILRAGITWVYSEWSVLSFISSIIRSKWLLQCLMLLSKELKEKQLPHPWAQIMEAKTAVLQNRNMVWGHLCWFPKSQRWRQGDPCSLKAQRLPMAYAEGLWQERKFLLGTSKVEGFSKCLETASGVLKVSCMTFQKIYCMLSPSPDHLDLVGPREGLTVEAGEVWQRRSVHVLGLFLLIRISLLVFGTSDKFIRDLSVDAGGM